MKETILITGSTGFLGTATLKAFPWGNYDKVVLAVRDSNKLPPTLPSNVVVHKGSLEQKDFCDQITPGVNTVIHMASATGKLKPETYKRAITSATENLIRSSEKANVTHFIYLSTIAVKFTKAPRYFYAQEKKRAEKIVTNSPLKTTILRPTMIFGAGSPVFDGFKSLASLPIIPVFGKGDCEVQPIAVEDAARSIIETAASHPSKDTVIDLGGKEKVSIKELLTMISSETGKKEPKFLHLPVSLIAAGLKISEPFIYSLLPFTLGQLASFRNNSSIDNLKKVNNHKATLKEMIIEGLRKEQPENYETLYNECSIYCRYLTGLEPNSFIFNKYRDYHARLKPIPSSPFDGLINRLASMGPVMTKICDSWCRFFFPVSLLRHKLTYLLGISETIPPYSNRLDSSDNLSIPVLFLKLGIRGIIMVFQILLASMFLIPGKVILHKAPKGEKR